MPRKKFFPQSDFYYHVTARCHNKEWFKIPLNEVWEILTNYLFFIKHGFNLEIYSFVLMNNHFHLILKTPEANLDIAMNYFMRETSKIISTLCGRINQVYGAPYHWSLIKNDIYFKHAYKYVYRNPVESNLVLRVQDYKYSTLHSKIGLSHTIIPTVEDTVLFSNVEYTLDWLNTDYPSLEIEDEIRKALKKNEFKFSQKKTRHKIY